MSEPLAFSNPKVQRLRRLLGRRSARLEEGVFVVEGATLIGEAVAAGWTIEAEFVATDAVPTSDAPVHQLAVGVFERVASTEQPQPNMAVVQIPEPRPLSEAVGLALIADRLADPGNLGTILRSCEAAGVELVVLTPGSVDPYNPKVVRASAGALFHLPVITAGLADVRAAGYRVVGTSSHRGVAHTDFDWSGKIAIVVGTEAQGLPGGAAVDDWVRIEHRGRAESLNVAMAATLLAFEATRHRAARAS